MRALNFERDALVRATMLTVLGLAVLLSSGLLPAQDQAPATLGRATVDEVDSRQRSELARIDALLANRQWSDAVDALERIAANAPTRMVAGDRNGAGFVRYLPAANDCQARLASWKTLAPEALAIYRRRVDPRAKELWEQALAGSATAPFGEALLVRIATELFASSFGDQALDRLAQLALQNGDYDAARRLWMAISPVFRTPRSMPAELAAILAAPAGAPWAVALQGVDLEKNWLSLQPHFAADLSHPELVYPDTDLPLAQLWANLATTSILQGDDDRAAHEIELLRRLHPKSTGRVAGRQGDLVELLQRLRAESQEWPSLPPRDDWPTFAGNCERSGTAAHELDPRGKPLWSVSLASSSTPADVYPIVVGGATMVFDGRYLRAFDLRTGAAWPDANADGSFFDSLEGEGTRHTLSAAGDRLYVRLGGPIVQRQVAAPQESSNTSSLAAFEWPTQRLLFRIAPPGAGWEFEGSPACRGDAIFVALRRTDQVQPQLYVAAYDALTGEPRWRSERICSAVSLASANGAEWPMALVTCHEDAIYLSANLGAVAALDAASGRLRWVTTYPRTADSDVGDAAELSPCLFHRGLLYAAPSDSNRVFALDAATGELVWRTRPGQTGGSRQLLGVGAGRLIVGGRRLHWLDAASGAQRGQFPAPAIDEPGVAGPAARGVGRGLLAGENVYFPTSEAILVFRQVTLRTTAGWLPIPVAEIALASRGATAGNLIAARGVLLLSSGDRLMAFQVPSDNKNHNANRYARERP